MLVATMLDIQVIADLYFQMKKKRLPVETISHRITTLLDVPDNTIVYDKQTSNLNIQCRQPHLSGKMFRNKSSVETKEQFDKALTLLAIEHGCMEPTDEPLRIHENHTQESVNNQMQYCKGGGGKDRQTEFCILVGKLTRLNVIISLPNLTLMFLCYRM